MVIIYLLYDKTRRYIIILFYHVIILHTVNNAKISGEILQRNIIIRDKYFIYELKLL